MPGHRLLPKDNNNWTTYLYILEHSINDVTRRLISTAFSHTHTHTLFALCFCVLCYELKRGRRAAGLARVELGWWKVTKVDEKKEWRQLHATSAMLCSFPLVHKKNFVSRSKSHGTEKAFSWMWGRLHHTWPSVLSGGPFWNPEHPSNRNTALKSVSALGKLSYDLLFFPQHQFNTLKHQLRATAHQNSVASTPCASHYGYNLPILTVN